jgi:hypothetical protein
MSHVVCFVVARIVPPEEWGSINNSFDNVHKISITKRKEKACVANRVVFAANHSKQNKIKQTYKKHNANNAPEIPIRSLLFILVAAASSNQAPSRSLVVLTTVSTRFPVLYE